jgi:hypothetical protein
VKAVDRPRNTIRNDFVRRGDMALAAMQSHAKSMLDGLHPTANSQQRYLLCARECQKRALRGIPLGRGAPVLDQIVSSSQHDAGHSCLIRQPGCKYRIIWQRNRRHLCGGKKLLPSLIERVTPLAVIWLDDHPLRESEEYHFN